MTRRLASNKLLSALFVLWANLALQPCAVASDADHDCPHCPPAHEEGMPAHHGHHAQKEAAQPCASMQPDCCDQDTSSVGPREPEQKVRDVFDQPGAVVETAPWPDTTPASRFIYPTGPPPPAAASPPLHLLNCVFLK